MKATVVRCAIYTRKSSDEGLEQSFNSLDAQRDACAAYIRSQASEGWTELAARYDDGGLSGGTLERPALQRLLGDIDAGRIDVVVVYKVDRLTRSLLDFAKLVERFEAHATSFLSVTQSFNTTTSMGRLTLNMLLSFAQFEREVTAERIRDKIAASKARGMWMGGVAPLGYKPDGRTLAVVDEHATFVRRLFERYLELGTVRRLADALTADGVRTPARATSTGKPLGARPLGRGQLYHLLKNPIYVGEIPHKEVTYPGLHPAIIDRDLWNAVQARLADQTRGQAGGSPRASASPLAGKLVDADGAPLIATHAVKASADGTKRRYRYYVSRSLHHRHDDAGMRLPARELERAVAERLAQLFDAPLALIGSVPFEVRPDQLMLVHQRCREQAARLRQQPAQASALLARVRVGDAQVELVCDMAAIARTLQLVVPTPSPAPLRLVVDAKLRRSGRSLRLVQADGVTQPGTLPNPALVRLVLLARRWWRELRQGELTVPALAAREGCSRGYVTRLLPLAFLSPAVIRAILAGTQRAGVDVAALTLAEPLPALWSEQARALLA